MTKPEQKMAQILESLGFVVKPYSHRSITDRANSVYSQVPFQTMRLDFALLKAKIAIEVNGDYWHGTKTTKLNGIQLKRKLDDAHKRTRLIENGWELISYTASNLDRPRSKDRIYQLILNALDV